jgi:hypothetical protein
MTFVSDASLPLPGMPDSAPALPAFQMMLIGQPSLYAFPNVCGVPGSTILPSCPAANPNATDGESSAGRGSAECPRPGTDLSVRRACPGCHDAGPCRRICSPTSLNTASH